MSSGDDLRRQHRRETTTRDLVALVLAIGLALAVCMLMFGVLWDALRSDTPGLSENATQTINLAFGGIIGILGSYLGFRAGSERADDERADDDAPDDTQHVIG